MSAETVTRTIPLILAPVVMLWALQGLASRKIDLVAVSASAATVLDEPFVSFGSDLALEQRTCAD